MTCQDAQEFASALHDREYVPRKIADHLSNCAHCRQALDAYSQIGAELRLAAARTPRAADQVPASLVAKASAGHPRAGYLTRKMLIPRFAVGATAGLLLIVTASFMTLRGQSSNPLWFSFNMHVEGSAPTADTAVLPQRAVKAGYDDVWVWGNSPNNVTAAHLAILSVQEHQVRLAIRAGQYADFAAADSIRVKKDLGDLSGHVYNYSPGDRLQIPIEGGRHLLVQGEVLDHQPRVLFNGIPLEPEENQIIATSPVLLSGNKVLSDMKGANAIRVGPGAEIVMYVPGTGLLKICLQPFTDSVEGTAEWGRLEFTWDGESYSLLTLSPITGGEQPRKVWVKIDSDFHPGSAELKNGFLSADDQLHPVW